MKRNQWKKVGSIIGFLAVAALALSGCSGDDGAPGATGPAGPAGQGAVTDVSKMTLGELGAVIICSCSPPWRVTAKLCKAGRGRGWVGHPGRLD